MFFFCAALVSPVRTGQLRSCPKVAFERGASLCCQAEGHFGGRRDRYRRGPKVAGEVEGQCEVCLAVDRALCIPTAGPPAVSPFNEKVQVDFAFLFSKDYFLVRILSENPLEVWGALAGFWITALAKPRFIQMNDGGEWRDGVRTFFLR